MSDDGLLRAPVRLTAVLTHPVQYFSPWFRHIVARDPRLALTVLYATTPNAERQGTGFARPVSWDVPLTEGYEHRVLHPMSDMNVGYESFTGVDAPGIGAAIDETRPDVVLLMGWHAQVQVRAMTHCRRRGIPLLYRGDSNLQSAPTGLRRLFWRQRTRLLLGQFSAALSVGHRARLYLLTCGVDPTRIFASPHCVDNAFFAEHAAPWAGAEGRGRARATFGIAPDTPVLVFAGKLEGRKRPGALLEAAARLADGTEVLFAGDGPERAALETQAARLGVRATFAGFLSQRELPRAYRAGECLVLPSVTETWGLVVNEALAAGTPVVVSEACGCADDLVRQPSGGGVRFDPQDIGALADAVRRLRARVAGGEDIDATCRWTVAESTYAAATEGLVAAAQLAAGEPWQRRTQAPPMRVLAPCGGMAIQGGMERATFEVLRVARTQGAHVHVVINTWATGQDARGRHPIAALAEAIGATWSTGYYWIPLSRHTRNPWDYVLMAQDVLRTSAGLLRDAWRVHPTHTVSPEHTSLIRNAPTLVLLRLLGVRTLLRMGNAPAPGGFYERLWRWVISPPVHAFIGNSHYVLRELVARGVPAAKTRYIPNHLYHADRPDFGQPRDVRRVIYVGQFIREKGVHLLLEALAQLRRDGVEVRADLVGDVDAWEPTPGYIAEVRARAAAPDLAPHVRLLGKRPDVLRLMSAAGLHAAPSLPEMYEGMPGVVIEAKAARLPTVAFAVGPFPEMIAHRVTGWLAREVTAEALAEGLRWFLDDPARRDAAGVAAEASGAAYSKERFEARVRHVLAGLPEAERDADG
ncbi:MAG: glycosyltransferase family 4 protein [Gemmatimonadetes bacterium]|nr:glycosyltransferase family 4 protein [Gemmatimonadota bacterium]